MILPKTWADGVADETWKQMIELETYRRGTDILQYLVYVLTDAGSDYERGLADIRKMSGADIVSAIQGRIKGATASIERGLAKK